MAGIREIFELVDRATAPLRNIEQQMERTTDAAHKLGNSRKPIIDLGEATQQLAKKARTVAVAFASIKTIQAAVQLSDQMTQIQARINGITGSMEETARIQNLIYQAAQRSRGSYTELMTTVAALKSQTGDTFKNMEEATAFAETLQKQFKIAGTDATGISSTMYNLTQALSTGVLRGQDLNIVMSNAPQIAQRIADYMGLSVGELKKVAAEGKVTADIVKNAMLGAAEDIDKEFQGIPKTFGDIMQQAKNMGLRAFQPISDAISHVINAPQVQGAINAIGTGLYFIASVAGLVIETIGNVFMAIGTILGNLFTIITGVATNVLHIGEIFVIVSTIIGGVVGGIMNILAILANAIITAAEQIYNIFLQVTHAIGTAFARMASQIVGGFAGVARSADAAATAIANAFISGANAAIGGINKLIEALNNIPGVSLSTVGEIGQVGSFGFADAVEEAAKGLEAMANAPAPEHVSLEKFDATGLIDGFIQGGKNGNEWAQGVLGGMAGQSDFGNFQDLLQGIENNTANAMPAGGNTGKVGKVGKVDNVKLSDEDLKIYRDLAERRYMNNIELKTLAPEINVTLPAGASGNISAQDVADRLKRMLIEQMAAQTSVAHA